MSSAEKILSVIREDSEKAITELQTESKEKCERIIQKAQKKADEIHNQALQKKAEQTAGLKKTYQSRIELEKRNMILKAKRAEINHAVDAILKDMNGLEDQDYFSLIYRLAKTLGKQEGVVFLNERDLKRVPKDFLAKMSESGIRATLSKEPDNSIESGFILKNGDIEENMSFAAVIAEKREAVEDVINRELFRD